MVIYLSLFYVICSPSHLCILQFIVILIYIIHVNRFYVFISLISLQSIFLKTNKMHKLNYNKIDPKHTSYQVPTPTCSGTKGPAQTFIAEKLPGDVGAETCRSWHLVWSVFCDLFYCNLISTFCWFLKVWNVNRCVCWQNTLFVNVIQWCGFCSLHLSQSVFYSGMITCFLCFYTCRAKGTLWGLLWL